MSLETFHQKNDSFEAKFMNTENVSLGDVEIPVHVLANEGAQDQNFLFIAPAYAMGVEEMYKDHALRAMYDEKRNIFTFDPPAKGAEFTLTEEENKKIKEYNFPPEEIRMAKTLIRVIEELKARGKLTGDKIDVAAHSRGMGYSTIAALLRPELFRTLGSYGGAGLIGKDSTPSLLSRVVFGQQHFSWWNPIDWGAEPTDLKKLARDIATEAANKNNHERISVAVDEEMVEAQYRELAEKKAAAAERGIEEYAAPSPEQKRIIEEVARKAGGATIKYLWAAPGRRLREIGGMANIQIDKALIKLSKEHGIGIVLAYGESDPVFPESRQKKYTMSQEFKDAHILLVSANGGHGTFGERPIMTRILTGAIDVMNAQRAKPEN